jgi:hypothetical protein
MFLSIPSKGSDAITFFDAEPFERRSQQLRAIGNFGVTCAARTIAHKRDDFAIGVNSPPVFEDVVYRQWTILHSA